MNSGGPRSFAYGVDAFLSRLSPHGQTRGVKAFPESLDRSLVRFQGSETIKQWFDRCTREFMPEGLEYWLIEENLAAFALVSWGQNNQLDFATINVLKTECSLQDYLELPEEDLKSKDWKDFSKPHYIRLDLDYGTIGPIGTHPLPHLHFSPDDPPRWTLDTSRSTNVVVDFMEFVYRHFFTERWLEWVERIWNRHYRNTGRNPDLNPYRRIVSAFAENEIGVLHDFQDEITQLTKVLKEEKSKLYELQMNATDRQLMTFPDSPQ